MKEFLDKVADCLELADVGMDYDFRSGDEWSSIQGLSLIMMMESDYHRKMSVEEFRSLKTVADLASACGINGEIKESVIAEDGVAELSESRMNDVKELIGDRFGQTSVRLLEYFADNPTQEGRPLGEVAYEGGRLMAFRAALRRRMYLKQELVYGSVGAMLVARQDASPVQIANLLKRNVAPREGSSIFFANTSNSASVKLNQMVGVDGEGPASCAVSRFAITYMPKAFRFLVRNPSARVLRTIDPAVFDGFWGRYLKSNVGLVTSRSAKELQWMFGGLLATGECVLLGAFSGQELVGYIIFKKQGGHFERWVVADWIALENNRKILKQLLVSAVRYLRKYTDAFMLQSVGFPDFVQPIIKWRMPFWKRCASMTFIWKAHGDRLAKIPEGSWFFGPYDGDRGMGIPGQFAGGPCA